MVVYHSKKVVYHFPFWYNHNHFGITIIFGIFFGITIIWYTNNYFGIPLWYTIFWYTHYWYTIFGIPIIGILFFGIPFLIYPFYLMVYPPEAGKFLKNVHKIIRKSLINHWKYKKNRLRRYKINL